MAAGGGGTTTRSLEDTPTWALATVCFVFVTISIFIEHLLHLLCKWLKRHRNNALLEAVQKLKTVLMLLGLMSLILVVTQKPISRICIPNKLANTMLPCRKSSTMKTKEVLGWTNPIKASSQGRRRLAATENVDHCGSKGMTSLISQDGMNQLNIFIFILAVLQIVYSFLTMALGRAKMKRWKTWEEDSQTIEYLAANDNVWASTRKFLYKDIPSAMEPKVDYLTLRHGFITEHLSGNNSFNFRKYIQRSLEDDFKAVIGISPFMWFIVVIFMLVDVHGWHVYLWVSFLPLIIVLVIGTKLEVIVARMALQIIDQNVIKGALLVQPNDRLFWFGQPRLVLTLLHFALFMNTFELAFLVWVTMEFGLKSCYHQSLAIIVIRVAMAVVVQTICSYITLPLYALVIQMGSQFKNAVLRDQIANAMKRWHAGVRDKRKRQKPSSVQLRDNYHNSNSSHANTSPNISSHFPRGIEIFENNGSDSAKYNTETKMVASSSSVLEIEVVEQLDPAKHRD